MSLVERVLFLLLCPVSGWSVRIRPVQIDNLLLQ
jgi:hypothetical protein